MKKKILLSAAFAVLTFIGLAQVPDAFNYQAVVRNTAGEVLANQNVSIRLSILQDSESGAVLYAETHSESTNNFGLINLKVGDGTPIAGVFSPGGWGITSHFLKVEIDPAGGSTFSHLGTSELLAVPYAFHAKTVEDDAVDDADASPTNEIQTLSISGSDLTLSEGGGTVTLPAPGVADNWGTQTVESDGTLSGVGTSGDPLSVNGDLSDDQTLSLSGDDLSISNGNSVNIGGADDQTLSVSGSDLSISNGNTVTLPSIWSTNGTSAYYNGGRVGIGTTNPVSQFTILGSETQSQQVFQNSATGSSFQDGFLIGNTGATAFLWNNENGGIRFATDNTSRLDIFNNGFIRVGTSQSSPSRLLDLHGGDTPVYLAFHHDNSGYTAEDGFLVGMYTSPSDAYLFNYEAGSIFLGTNNLVRMEIDESGNIGINTFSPTHTLSVNGTASKTGGGAWSVFSDRRLKDLHGNYEKGLSEILALRPVVFNYREDNPLDLPSDVEEIGLIAQEVKEIFPEAVKVSQNGYLDFNMHPINVAFVNAIKELKTENDNLRYIVSVLESRLAEIEKMLQQ